jgi:UDP:flavonoid glycosyltransferase YjiC (YdhE family)
MSDRKLILIIMQGTSALNGSFSLARALLQRGHDVVYFSEEKDREYIEMQGFKFHGIQIPEYMKEQQAKYWQLNKVNKLRFRLRETINLLNAMYSVCEEWVEEIRPDLLLLDANYFQFSIPFLNRNIPIINLSCTLATFYSRKHAPVFAPLLPAAQPKFISRIKAKLAWERIFIPQRINETIHYILLRIGFGFRKFSTIQSMIKKRGMRLGRTEYGLRLMVPEIILGPKCLDFSRTDAEGTRWYLDACVDENRTDPEFDFELLDHKKGLIFCAMGTCSPHYNHVERFCECLFEVMEELPEYQLIIQTQGIKDLSKFSSIPANVKILGMVPQLEMLRRAKIFITHGGFSSYREGVYFGKPMIVFPGWHDQPGNAVRVEYYNLGARGDMRTITAPRLLSMIKKVLEDEKISESVARMQHRVRDSNELQAAISFIEEFSE